MCVDRAGIVGNDGETHQGVFDLSFFGMIPNIVVMAPKDFKEFENMLEYAIELKAPVAIRYPRGGEGKIKYNTYENLKDHKIEIIKKGKDLTIIAIGKMVDRALEISNILEKQEKKAEVINVRFLKPLDEENILESIIKTKKVITIEDNILRGGLGSSVEELILKKGLKNIELKKYGYPDEFIKHGSVTEIEEKYGLNADQIAQDILCHQELLKL